MHNKLQRPAVPSRKRRALSGVEIDTSVVRHLGR
jgi:hypothetical protein